METLSNDPCRDVILQAMEETEDLLEGKPIYKFIHFVYMLKS